jgi:hypothetical protein
LHFAFCILHFELQINNTLAHPESILLDPELLRNGKQEIGLWRALRGHDVPIAFDLAGGTANDDVREW